MFRKIKRKKKHKLVSIINLLFSYLLYILFCYSSSISKMSNKPKGKNESVDSQQSKKQRTMEPSEVLNNYINQLTTNEQYNVYEIDSVIQWDDLVNFRQTSECKEFKIIIDKFERINTKPFPRGFWDSKKCQKLYLMILRIKLGTRMRTMESLYKISQNDLKKNYGGGLLAHKYNDSPNLILSSLYPKHENLRMFGSFKGTTPNGIPILEYWAEDNPKKPHEVFMHTKTKYEFNCDACPHSFSTSLSNIVNGSWCPYCANRALCENSLTCPTCLAKTFHSFDGKTSSGTLKVQCWSKRNKKQPHEVALQCNGKFEFICDACQHPFKSVLANIVNGQWCPYCSNPPKKLCDDTLSCKTCIAKTFYSFEGKTPNGKLKLEYWHEDNPLQPHEVFMNSTTKYEFNCDACPHSFKSGLDQIVRGSWCPYCANKELCNDTKSCPTCIPKTFHFFKGKRPNGIPILEYWHDDNPKKPHEVFMHTKTKYEFNCDACPHSFSTSLSNIVNGSWCPYCANQKLCEDTLSCPTCLKKTFYAFDGETANEKFKVDCWDEENPIEPYHVFMNSDKIYRFKCDMCPHSFKSGLDQIVRGSWCPYCVNAKRCDDTLSCKTCLAKTFHSFDGKTSSGTLKVQCWSKRNKKQPHEVALQCNGKFEFICDACQHPFKSVLANIVNGSWCPYCANKKLCDDTLSCQSCLKKTFHSFDIKTPNGNKVLDCWNKENPKNPHEVFMKTHTKYKFNCDACQHSFESAIFNIVKGKWCPTCKNKTEQLVLEFLQTVFSKKDVKHQFKHEKVKNIRELPFDICILPHQIIIEVDGGQHFFDVSYFRSHAVEQCERDCNKMKIIFEEGYCVIRIVQEDIWLPKTRDEVLTKLEKAIEECIHNELPMIHYISMDNSMYDNHKRITESYPPGESTLSRMEVETILKTDKHYANVVIA